MVLVHYLQLCWSYVITAVLSYHLQHGTNLHASPRGQKAPEPPFLYLWNGGTGLENSNSSCFFFSFFSFFKAGSYDEAHVGFEFEYLLPWPLNFWDHRCMQPCLAPWSKLEFLDFRDAAANTKRLSDWLISIVQSWAVSQSTYISKV